MNPGAKRTLYMIIRAAQQGRLDIMECKDMRTGESVPVLVVLTYPKDGSIGKIPSATLFNTDPYEFLAFPDPDGGFVEPE